MAHEDPAARPRWFRIAERFGVDSSRSTLEDLGSFARAQQRARS